MESYETEENYRLEEALDHFEQRFESGQDKQIYMAVLKVYAYRTEQKGVRWAQCTVSTNDIYSLANPELLAIWKTIEDLYL